MKRMILMVLTTIIMTSMTVYAEDIIIPDDKGTETITIVSEKNRKPADFPHWQHQERFECAVCHNDTIPTEWTKDTGHDTCKICHKEYDVPTTCNTCHPKVKRAYEGC